MSAIEFIDVVEVPRPPGLMTVDQVTDVLAIGRTTVYELIKSNDLELVHVRRCARITVDSVTAYIERCRRAEGS